MSYHRTLAFGLTWLRLALAPVVVGIALRGGPAAAIAGLLVAGLVSDILDGMVARAGGVATAGLRRLDSAVDTVFYLGVALAAWLLFPAALRANAVGIALVLGTQAFNHAVEYAKFRREASYHAWSAKAWGLALFAALFELFVRGSGSLLPLAIAAGLVSHAENLAITAVLPEWRHDVPSVVHALRIRRASRGVRPPGPAPRAP